MHSAIEIEQPLPNDSKIRKSKRVPVPSEHYPKQSVKDPKIIKQLIKASEKYEISKLIQELKDEEEMVKEENEPSTTVKSETVSHSKMEVIDVDKDDQKSKLEVPFDFQEKIITEFQAFIKLYKEIVSGKNKSSKDFDESFYDNKNNLYLLAKLYYLCEENYYEANALQLWKDLSKCFTEEELATMNQNPKEFYKTHLFFFDRFSKTNKTKEDLLEVLKLNVDYLSDPFTFYAPDSGNFTITPEFLEETAKHQCSLLKGFVNVLGIDPQLFSIANIMKTHPDEIIDVVSQNPDLYGFIQDTKKTYQYKKKITLHEYSNYQKESSIRMPQYVKDKNGMIQFAVNIDFDGWKEHMDELVAKVPPEWLFDSKKDGMRVVNQKIRGVNLPQFFLKVEGAWTGGHEENLRLRAVNFNHGPDSCVWYTIGTESSKDFRAFVKDQYSLDIHKDEGLWFGDIDLCIKNKIKIQYFVQEPGDIVLLGPGCLHWVRCLGITMNSAWNICSQDKLQFEKAFEREKINREISFKSIIPIKHISLNLFKQDFESLPRDLQIYLGEKLVELYSEEMKAYDEFMKKYPSTTFTPEDKGSTVYNCALCNYETLNFYTYCAGCSAQKKPKRIAVLTCLNCYDAHLKECKTEGSQIYFYCKLTPDTVRKFQQLLAKIKNGSSEDLVPFKNLTQYLDGLSGDGQSAKNGNNKETPVTEKKEPELKRQKSETKNKDAEKTISPDRKGKTEKMEEEKLDDQDKNEKPDDEAGADEREKEQTSKKKGSSKKASNNSDKKKGKGSQKGKNANVKVSLSNEPISESTSKPEVEENDENEVEPGKRKLSGGDEEDDKAYVIKKKVKTNMIDLDREISGTQQDEGKTEVSQSQNSGKSSLQIKGNDKEEMGRHAHDNFFINKLSDQ